MNRPRSRDGSIGALAFGALVLGTVALVSDLRGYGQWPRREAQVVRHETGFGWTVPVYRVACYEGLDEVHGAKFGFLDGSPPGVGTTVTVACKPASEGLGAFSASDQRALLDRDAIFVLVGAVAGAVTLRRRMRRDAPRDT